MKKIILKKNIGFAYHLATEFHHMSVVEKILSLIHKEEHFWIFLLWQHTTSFIKLEKSELVFLVLPQQFFILGEA